MWRTVREYFMLVHHGHHQTSRLQQHPRASIIGSWRLPALTQKSRCNAVVPESRHGRGRCASHSSLTFAPMSMSFFDGATMLKKTVCKCKQHDGARWSRFNLVRILSDYQCKHDIVGWTKKEWWTNGCWNGDVCSSFFCCCKDNKMQ